MNSELSPRLLACANFVPRGSRVADICCDHGYLGIHLLEKGIATSVIASDINLQPLQSAREHVRDCGLGDCFTLCLSDGVTNIPKDFDTLVCAGVGADVMISILEHGPWLRDSRYTLVLQCQSKVASLRKYLYETGFRILGETVVRDGRFLYSAMQVVFDPRPALTPGECYFPHALLENPSPDLREYYNRTVKNLAISVEKSKNPDPFQVQALAELRTLPENYPELKEILL